MDVPFLLVPPVRYNATKQRSLTKWTGILLPPVPHALQQLSVAATAGKGQMYIADVLLPPTLHFLHLSGAAAPGRVVCVHSRRPPASVPQILHHLSGAAAAAAATGRGLCVYSGRPRLSGPTKSLLDCPRFSVCSWISLHYSSGFARSRSWCSPCDTLPAAVCLSRPSRDPLPPPHTVGCNWTASRNILIGLTHRWL